MTTLRMPLWDRSRLLAGLAVVYLVLTWQVMADFEGIMSYPEALRVIAEAHPWIFWLLGAEALRQAHGLIGERWSGYHRFWSGRVFGGFARWSRRRFSAGTRFRAARALKIAFWLVTLSPGARRGARHQPVLRAAQGAREAAGGSPGPRDRPGGRRSGLVPVAGRRRDLPSG